MKKSGFSLAEVLITVAIIGVISALTLPTLQKNISKSQIPPALAKAINTLENANRLLMQKYDARNLVQLCPSMDGDAFEYLACLKKHGIINIAKLPDQKIYKTFDDTEEFNTDCYVGNDGIAYCEREDIKNKESTNKNLPSTYDGRYSLIYVDVNGVEKGVSTVGKDAFLLYVDYKGAVIPAGSLLFKDYSGENAKTWKEECNAKEVTGNGEACAGSIIDNGLKVIYKF